MQGVMDVLANVTAPQWHDPAIAGFLLPVVSAIVDVTLCVLSQPSLHANADPRR